MPAGYLAGFHRAYVWIVGANGYATGTQTTLAVNSTSSAYLLDSPKTAGFQGVDPTALDIQGGDKIVATFQFGNAKAQPFDLIASDLDSTFISVIASMTNYTTNSKYTIGSHNPNLTNPVSVGVALVQRFQNKTVGSDGPDQYCTHIFPRCTMRTRISGPAFQAGNDVSYRITPTFTNKFLNGMTFDSTSGTGLAMGLEDNRTDYVYAISQYPTHLTTYRANGVATTFITGYRPISTTVTLNATENFLSINATPTALSSISATTGVATLAAAGSSGDYDVLLYQTNYVAI